MFFSPLAPCSYGVAMSRIVIFANGQLPDPPKAAALLQRQDFLIGADGGTRHILSLGLKPHVVIGDLDSLNFTTVAGLEKNGVTVLRYPTDKDATDLELALDYALQQQPEELLVMAALGNRLDQTLANLALLTDPRFAALPLRLDDGVEEILICRDQAQIRGRSGDLVSLIPWAGAVEGIHTEGLRWPLHDEILYPHKTRGISNELLSGTARVQIKSGVLLIVHRR